MKRIAVLTSGGDAPGMNAAIRAVTRCAIHNGMSVAGVNRGYQGLIEGDMFDMTSRSVGDIIQRAGTILRSARSEEFMTEAGRRKALDQMSRRGIEALVVIGGDGTFRGARALAAMGVPAVGIPATIDNDIAFTDYSLGFDTAVNTALDAITKIRDTASSHGRSNVIEVMGRDTGHLALAAGVAGGAEYILIPEVPYDLDAICEGIKAGYRRGKTHSIIVVAEGVGGYHSPDELHHESIGFKIGDAVQERTGLDTRVTVLGYIQRGGAPTARDRLLATVFGCNAVALLMQSETAKVVGVVGEEIRAFDIDEVAATRKKVDIDLYNLAVMLSGV
ncbi:MAG: 6-phosphofructokinase [Clostridia bacterium]